MNTRVLLNCMFWSGFCVCVWLNQYFNLQFFTFDTGLCINVDLRVFMLLTMITKLTNRSFMQIFSSVNGFFFHCLKYARNVMFECLPDIMSIFFSMFFLWTNSINNNEMSIFFVAQVNFVTRLFLSIRQLLKS